jgi:single-strand DNA-binding protein
MKTLGKLKVIGYVSGEPKLETSNGGTTYFKFSVRWYENRKDSDKTMFMDCIAFGNTAEYMSQKVKRGEPVFVEGELINDRWKDDQGRNRDSWTLKVREYVYLSTRPSEQSESFTPAQSQSQSQWGESWGEQKHTATNWSQNNARSNDPF